MNLETQRSLLRRAAAHLAAGTTDMAPHCLRVRPEHYLGQDQLAHEVDALFRRAPLIAALSPDLPEPGSHLARELCETPILLARGNDGVVRAFLNVCRHRGTRLSEGRGHGQRFVCPFHAWTYDLEGRVRSRPMSCEGFHGIGKEFDQLTEVSCRETAGMILVQLEGADIDARIDALIGAIRGEVTEYRIADHQYVASRETERDCNYKFIMDGFGESYHLKVLHKDTIAPYYYGAPALVDAIGPVARIIGVRTGLARELEKPIDEQRFVRHGTIQYMIPPNALLCHQIDHIQFWQFYPVANDPDRCRVALHLYWPKPVDEDGARKAAHNLELLWKVTTTEDFPQARAIHANLRSGAVRELVFGRNEPALIHYHEQIAAAAETSAISAIDSASAIKESAVRQSASR